MEMIPMDAREADEIRVQGFRQAAGHRGEIPPGTPISASHQPRIENQVLSRALDRQSGMGEDPEGYGLRFVLFAWKHKNLGAGRYGKQKRYRIFPEGPWKSKAPKSGGNGHFSASFPHPFRVPDRGVFGNAPETAFLDRSNSARWFGFDRAACNILGQPATYPGLEQRPARERGFAPGDLVVWFHEEAQWLKQQLNPV